MDENEIFSEKVYILVYFIYFIFWGVLQSVSTMDFSLDGRKVILCSMSAEKSMETFIGLAIVLMVIMGIVSVLMETVMVPLDLVTCCLLLVAC